MVQEILELAQHKNHFLEKFFNLNHDEIKFLENSQLDGLDAFHSAREKLLVIIQEVDEKIGARLHRDLQISADARETLKISLRRKDHLVREILRQDLTILSLVQKAKDQVIKDLTEVKKSRQTIGKYRGRLDHLGLDEEI